MLIPVALESVASEVPSSISRITRAASGRGSGATAGARRRLPDDVPDELDLRGFRDGEEGFELGIGHLQENGPTAARRDGGLLDNCQECRLLESRVDVGGTLVGRREQVGQREEPGLLLGVALLGAGRSGIDALLALGGGQRLGSNPHIGR